MQSSKNCFLSKCLSICSLVCVIGPKTTFNKTLSKTSTTDCNYSIVGSIVYYNLSISIKTSLFVSIKLSTCCQKEFTTRPKLTTQEWISIFMPMQRFLRTNKPSNNLNICFWYLGLQTTSI